LEEVYKVTTDQLDWVNPEGQQYPHNLLQPLQLIPDNRGRSVIPFEHFINKDLEYLRGDDSSRKYTTSVTKTKAADYGHNKWIEDLVPRAMWIQEPISYDKHALWGVSHWGRKHQQFYGFAVNRESALDVFSKRGIIAVTELKIVEWHNYKHPDWISKLSNLTVEERFAFNVSLRMFIRSIVIQRRVKDLQLGVKSYQKRLNLTKPDTYRSDLNDGTLNDVRNALDDHIKGIRMQYFPTTSWRKRDKARAAAMIQAIDKMLKTRRIMRSLERFALVEAYDADKIILDTYQESTILKRTRKDDDQEGPTVGSDRGSKRERAGREHASASTPSEPATRSAGRSTTGSQSRQLSSKLKYHLEEVYKATTNQLDWVNTEGQQYPHNLLQPLPLIPDNRGRSVIPFEHFINNDLEYLRGGDLKRLRIQDIEDMLLLLVQGNLSNLTVEEHFTFNVSLRMFTRSIVIQRRVEDLQLGVKSYQKRLNLTRPDTNEMLNDVRNALDDRLKGIRMQYLPTTIWRRRDKARAVAMIQAIDKMLKTRGIIRSLERFVGGRQYEGDFRMLQRTI
nr:hypothetical protein [Tanacetum cinerariifolium]